MDDLFLMKNLMIVSKRKSSTEKHWNSFWSSNTYPIYNLGNWVFWILFYKKFLQLIDLHDPDILELGGGIGGISYKMVEKMGGKITIVDYSQLAKEKSDNFFKNKNFSPRYIFSDIFNLKPKEKYDLVHSHGLIEHYVEAEREVCFARHIEFMKDEGYGIILAPTEGKGYNYFAKPLVKVLGLDTVSEVPLNQDDIKSFVELNPQTQLISVKKRFGWIGILFQKKCLA